MLISGEVLLHDNARPHTSTEASTRALLEYCNWDLFDHPTYNSDVAPSDYHRFSYLRNLLVSHCVNNNEELMEDVKTWLSSQTVGFLETDKEKLIPRYGRCLNSGDDYFEK
jgi:hypothetical protein